MKDLSKAKYGLITIDIHSSNRGNRLIEYAVKKMLGLPDPLVQISAFHVPHAASLEQMNKMDFVLIPGATILAKDKNQGLALDYLDKIKVPRFCVASGGWKPHFPINEFALKHIDGPVGVRDLDTIEECKRLGKDYVFTGCPTAFLDSSGPTSTDKFIIIGYGRKQVPDQKILFEKVKNYHKLPLVSAIQEPSFEKPIAKVLNTNIFSYDNPEDVYKKYSKCQMVVTGRLHGVLPALSQNKPVVFFGNKKDSRFGLLSYLQIPINDVTMNYDKKLVTYAKTYRPKIEELKLNLAEWRKSTIETLY